MATSDSSRWDRRFAIGLLVAGVGGLVGLPLVSPKLGSDAAKDDAKISQRSGASIKLGAKLAELYGIHAEPAPALAWRSTTAIFGRVVPNPNSTAELRAPFAGSVSSKTWPGVGVQVGRGQELAMINARFSPQERLDVQSKAAEAQEKVKGAEDVVKIHMERVQRLSAITGIVPGAELDLAKVQLAEAKAQYAGALAQAQLWLGVTKSLDSQTIAVPLTSPLEGEVVEVGVRPGTAIEAGALLLKIVDFRQSLIRLDVPAGFGMPAAEIDIETPGGDGQRRVLRARRVGPAANVDPASQFVGYYYDADAGKESGLWRPGLFVTAQVADPASATVEAVETPAGAVLYHQGRALVYVELSPGRFERREVQVLGRRGDYLFLGRGVRAGERVVTRHAQALLSEEFRGDADDD